MHRCERPVGNTVDVEKADYTNEIGDALLMGFFEDDDFDPKERAFYYARVLEIPTPRWTTYDAAFSSASRVSKAYRPASRTESTRRQSGTRPRSMQIPNTKLGYHWSRS